MKVTISIGGPFPTPYRLAEFLEQRERLERIISPMPRFRLGATTLPKARLITLPFYGYFNYGLSKLPYFSGVTPRQYWFSEMFDQAAALRLGECDLFNGWCSTALHSMRQAKSCGALTVLQTGSAHILSQKELMEAEYAKFGIRKRVTDPRIVEKGIQEYAEADHIVVPSSFIRASLIAGGVSSKKISLAQDAVTRVLKVEPKQDKVFRIICVGRVEIRKGIPYILEAFQKLNLPNSELVLVGGIQDEMLPILKQYTGYFRSVGWVPDNELDRIYSQSSVFVLPSVEDGWGHVTLEAMSCGMPVIVSANAGSADVVQEGVNGFVVPACSTEAIMEKIEYLFEKPELRQEMGRQAKLSIKERNWEKYGQEMLSIFETLLSTSKGLAKNG